MKFSIADKIRALAKMMRAVEHMEDKPRCFWSNPGPQDQAENCCDTCPFNRECLIDNDV